MSGSTSKFPRAFLTAIVAALLALHASLAIRASLDLGITGDETVHLTGGYSYWKFDDYRLHPENGNLPQRWAAIPLWLHHANLEPNVWPQDWATSNVWMMGQHFFFESGNTIDYEVLCARTMMMVWSVATGCLVFFWSRRLWGNAGGLFSLSLYVLSPTVLAHSPLITSDTCAAFWLLAATGAWWRLLRQCSPGRLLLSIASFSGALLAKFSSMLLGPIFLVLVCGHLVLRRNRSELDEPPPPIIHQAVKIAGLVVVHLAAAWTAIWASYGFRYAAFAPDQASAALFSPTLALLPSSGILRSVTEFALQHRLLPEAFLHGFAYVVYGARERASFAAGEYGTSGWWWFFPFAFWVKSSLAELITTASLAGQLIWRSVSHPGKWINRWSRVTPLIVLLLVYGISAMTSHLNIGQRHILPLYVGLFVLAGGLVRSSGALRWALPALVLTAAAMELASISPHYLAFFNRLAGGPANGWRLLGDSSLDWGQNLPRLQGWLVQHRLSQERVYLSYFGADDPFYRQINPVELAPYFRFGRPALVEALEPGLYCIGASMLQDAASPFRGQWTAQKEAVYETLKQEVARKYSDSRLIHEVEPGSLFWNFERARFARLCNYLRVRNPDAEISHMIFIFRLSKSEIHAATDGSLGELATLIESAVTRRQ